MGTQEVQTALADVVPGEHVGVSAIHHLSGYREVVGEIVRGHFPDDSDYRDSEHFIDPYVVLKPGSGSEAFALGLYAIHGDEAQVSIRPSTITETDLLETAASSPKTEPESEEAKRNAPKAVITSSITKKDMAAETARVDLAALKGGLEIGAQINHVQRLELDPSSTNIPMGALRAMGFKPTEKGTYELKTPVLSQEQRLRDIAA